MIRMRGFLSRIFRREMSEEETRLYSLGELAAKRSGEQRAIEREQAHGFTVERAAEIIEDLPPDIPQKSAVRIVRRTLEAVGIKVEDLERSTRARESKLGSELEFARNRQEELRQKTEEVEHSLDEEIRKAREARDTGIAEEEENIARAAKEREEVRRVRAFFGFPSEEEAGMDIPPAPPAGPPGGPTGGHVGDETQILDPLDLRDSLGGGARSRPRRPGSPSESGGMTESGPHGPLDPTDDR